MPDNALEILITDADVPTIQLLGEVDYHNAQRIRDAASQLVRDGRTSVNFDVGKLEFIDSSGLSALLDAAKATRSKDGRVRLLHPSQQLIHVLTISGFATFFEIAPKERRPTNSETAISVERQHAAWHVTQFVIPPKTVLIAEVRNRVAEFAEALPFSKQDIEDIKLAVGEASSNALRYGCPNTKDKITIRCTHDGCNLTVQVRDNGPCFDPDSIGPPPVEALDEGGRGIYFMRVLMDEVKFHFGSGGTMVELVKRCHV